ncbi:helicase-related protein [Salinigranum marinum]|uniref:helicase-related protein n=1 Tax=Salinigranum marinum TaxID=1515595 RepID=UPI002989E6D4|nr:helicase-related protein [Salinigranum marinum]
MLLADDVGLGKTIEAGLITSELMARNQAERILIITPANLREQWREAMNYFFHIDADIISRRHRKAMEKEIPPGTSPWEHHSKLIVSIDYAKQNSIRNEILSQDWDLVIIDEAHQAAKPHESSPNETVDMQRWDFATEITEHAEHCLLLTATPHNGYSDSFASLLRMLDVGAVSGPRHDPDINRQIAQQHVVQRRRDDVKQWFADAEGDSPFPERDQDEVRVTPTNWETETYDAVREYGDLLMSTAKSSGAKSETLARWSVIHFLKRALSSPEALRQSLKNRQDKLEERLDELDEEDTIQETAGISESMAQANALDNDPGEEYSEEEVGERVERVVAGDRGAIRRELDALDDVLEKAERITKTRDSKLQKLLDETLPNRFQYPRVILFTKYVDTLEYLESQIQESTNDETDVFTLHGSLNEAQRKERFAEFEESSRAVLIATDVISEGMNLQHASNQIIHYELPWNPNRLEQRNGRIDRYGQKEDEVVIRTMVVEDKMDVAVLETLVRKANQIREDYGFSPPYFGDDEGILSLLEDEGIDAGVPQATLEEFGSNTTTARSDSVNAFDDDTLDRIRSESFYGHTEVGLDEVQKRQEETHQRIGGSGTLEEFVKSALNLFNCDYEINVQGYLDIEMTSPRLRGPDIMTEYENVTFDPGKASQSSDTEMLDIAHPLVQRLIEAVKETALTDEDRYGRTATRGTIEVDQPTAVYTALVRYVADTDPNPTIMEELIQVGLPVYGNSPLDQDLVGRLEDSEAKPVQRSQQEKQTDLRSAIEHDGLDDAIDDLAEQRRDQIVDQRTEMRERLKESGAGGWATGIDDVETASTDLLTVTVYYPSA